MSVIGEKRMKTKIFFIAMLCLMLVSLQGVMLVNAKMGSITFHVFKDLDDDKMFDANEPSPPWAVVNLKKQDGINRFRFVVFSGGVTYRFVLYPYDYHLFANYFRCPEGLGVEDWSYEGTLRLDKENMGSVVYVPLNYTFTPGP